MRKEVVRRSIGAIVDRRKHVRLSEEENASLGVEVLKGSSLSAESQVR